MNRHESNHPPNSVTIPCVRAVVCHAGMMSREMVQCKAHPSPRIPREIWQPTRAAYLARVRPWADDRLRRMSRQEKHPVHDFLFEYYSFRPAHLCRWTPGFGVVLEDATRADVPWAEFVESDTGLSLPAAAFPGHRIAYLRWAVQYLEVTLRREPA